MKRVLALVIVILVHAGLGLCRPVKTYQVTGPVLEVTDKMIAVDKKVRNAGKSSGTRTPK